MTRIPVTAIGRPIDPRHASNRFVVAATLVAGAGVWGWSLCAGSDGAFGMAFRAAAVVFLAWALGRELDPDDTWTAGIAAPLALIGLWWGNPALGALAGFLIAGRLVVRTTGLSPTVVDSMVLVAACAYLGRSPVSWAAGAALVTAIVADRYLRPSGPPRLIVVAALGAAGAVAAALAFASSPVWASPGVADLVAVVVVGFAMAASLRPNRPISTGDVTGEPIERHRLVAARVGAGVGIAATFALVGATALGALGPLAAAVVAVTLTRLVRRVVGVSATSRPVGETQKRALAS